MLFVDDVLFSPVKGLLFVFQEIHRAAAAELHDTGSVVQQLQDLYMRLETGRIDEAEFAHEEAVLLDRLDAAHAGEEKGP